MKIDRHKVFVYLTLIPVLLTAFMIYSFSAQNGEESSKTSGRIVEEVVKIIEPTLEKLDEKKRADILESLPYLIRKSGHFVEYAMLGFFLLLHVKVRRSRFAFLCACGVGVLYAITDELHQLFVQARSGQASDVLLDSCGVFTGALVMLGIWTLIRYIRGRYATQDVRMDI